MDKIRLHPKVRIVSQTSGGHHFFGYYDLCPWSADGTKLIAHEVNFIDRLPTARDRARIGYLDLATNKFRVIAETRAWNFQQGARLQWLGPDFNRRVIFNDYQDGKFVSVILDVETGENIILPSPIYSVSPNGRTAVSMNFSRLDAVREGYGYRMVGDVTKLEDAPSDDGIFADDLENSFKKLIISLADLKRNELKNPMDGGRHWVDQPLFNPSGNRFVFLHRWIPAGGGLISRFYSANSDGNELRLLLDTGMASHFTWKNDEEVVIWGRTPGAAAEAGVNSLVRRFVVPIYHALVPKRGGLRQKLSGDGYLMIRDKSGVQGRIGRGLLTEDGHCSYSPDGKWLLTDTYAGGDKMRNLLLFNLDSGELTTLGSFYALPSGQKDLQKNWDSSALRCDLHPRFSRDGLKICVDSVHEGSRQVYVLEVSEITKN